MLIGDIIAAFVIASLFIFILTTFFGREEIPVMEAGQVSYLFFCSFSRYLGRRVMGTVWTHNLRCSLDFLCLLWLPAISSSGSVYPSPSSTSATGGIRYPYGGNAGGTKAIRRRGSSRIHSFQ